MLMQRSEDRWGGRAGEKKLGGAETPRKRHRRCREERTGRKTKRERDRVWIGMRPSGLKRSRSGKHPQQVWGWVFPVDHISLMQVGPALPALGVQVCFEYCYSNLQKKYHFQEGHSRTKLSAFYPWVLHWRHFLPSVILNCNEGARLWALCISDGQGRAELSEAVYASFLLPLWQQLPFNSPH